MAYHLYTTPGIVLVGKPSGEFDKYYYLFTRDLGVVVATAKSVRKPESKLSASLDDFSFGEFSLIKGKREWKITNARDSHNLYRLFSHSIEKRATMVRILRVIQKLVVGEQMHEALFSSVSDGFVFLEKTRLTKEELVAFQCVAILRILHLLGYGKDRDAYESFVSTSVWSTALLSDAIPQIESMKSDIDVSLEISQLT
jgi:DNA repair protein RecO (recombination protein O)